MAANTDLSRTSNRAITRALMYGIGHPDFIAECKADFFGRMEAMKQVRDPEVSRYNLEQLRNGKFDFIVTRGDVCKRK